MACPYRAQQIPGGEAGHVGLVLAFAFAALEVVAAIGAVLVLLVLLVLGAPAAHALAGPAHDSFAGAHGRSFFFVFLFLVFFED